MPQSSSLDSLSGPESIDPLLRVGEYVNAMREAESAKPPDNKSDASPRPGWERDAYGGEAPA